jgi:HlyD family secretion protein
LKRFVAAFVLLSLALGGVLAWRLGLQREEAARPPGSSAVVEGRPVRVASRLAARIAKLHAEEGDRVEAGALLVELDCSEPDAAVAEAEARLAAARAAVSAAEAQAQAAGLQGRAASSQAAGQAAQVVAAEVQAAEAVRQRDRLDKLRRDQVIAESALDQGTTAAEALAQKRVAADSVARAATLQAAAARSQAGGAAAQVESARAQVTAVEAALARARAMQRECRLVAPRGGVVTVRAREEGEVVLPGATIFEIRDPAELEVTFYVANEDLGRVRVGTPVTVLADAFPGQRFRGSVTRVAEEAEFTPRTVQTRSDRERLVYEVVASLDRSGGRLRAGMPVEVTLGDAGGG